MAEPRFVLDPELTPALTGDLLDCWVEATNAGGAVGFTPPVTRADVEETAAATFAACPEPDHLLVGLGPDDRVVCWLVLNHPRVSLYSHWRRVLRVMVRPAYQGLGHGARLMRAAEDAGRKLGVEALHLTVRGGTGTEGFYARLGYAEVGRIPNAIRVAPGDDREEIYMVRGL
ncbi:GNAT family N-acetyltransferase [Streptosporangium sp. NPDC023615]|uniref:GNAT family N-acetyltransferase n=1 Tax=Streptosporangium sp. NPDC023615 TaxID=3154794 RepID=UPI00341EC4AF